MQWKEDAQAWIMEVAQALLEQANFENATMAFETAEKWAIEEVEESGTQNVNKWLSVGDVMFCAFGDSMRQYPSIVYH